jgi:hypothetical protein
MMKILEEAIEKVRKLPEERQAYAAEVLEQIAAAGGDVFAVPQVIGPPCSRALVKPNVGSS